MGRILLGGDRQGKGPPGKEAEKAEVEMVYLRHLEKSKCSRLLDVDVSLGVSLGEVGFILQKQEPPQGLQVADSCILSRLESSRETMGLPHPLLTLLLHTHAHACADTHTEMVHTSG